MIAIHEEHEGHEGSLGAVEQSRRARVAWRSRPRLPFCGHAARARGRGEPRPYTRIVHSTNIRRPYSCTVARTSAREAFVPSMSARSTNQSRARAESPRHGQGRRACAACVESTRHGAHCGHAARARGRGEPRPYAGMLHSTNIRRAHSCTAARTSARAAFATSVFARWTIHEEREEHEGSLGAVEQSLRARAAWRSRRRLPFCGHAARARGRGEPRPYAGMLHSTNIRRAHSCTVARTSVRAAKLPFPHREGAGG